MQNFTLSTTALEKIIADAKKEAKEEAEKNRSPTQLFMKTSEVVALTGLSRFRIDELRKKGEIPCKKMGNRYYFPTRQLIEWAENLEEI